MPGYGFIPAKRGGGLYGCLTLAAILIAAAGCATLPTPASPGPRGGQVEGSGAEAPAGLPATTTAEEKGGYQFSLGPFFSWSRDGQRSEFALRPFFSSVEDKVEGTVERQVLFPLVSYRRSAERQSLWILPFFYSDRPRPSSTTAPPEVGQPTPLEAQPSVQPQLSPEAGAEAGERRLIFLNWFRFRGEEGEESAGLFPFYGELHHRLKRDRLRFVLWPLYTESEQAGNRTYTLLWPLFSYSSGGGQRGIRLWPLFGRQEKAGEWVKTFALWPFFHSQRQGVGEEAEEYFAVLPFYVRAKRAGVESRSVLWPFFSHTTSADGSFEEWDLPFPFYQSIRRQEERFVQSFPFFGMRKREGFESRYYLWPLYKWEREQADGQVTISHRFLLVNRVQSQYGNGQGEARWARSIKIFPLFSYERRFDGSSRFTFPDLMPVALEGFERNYAPLLRLLWFDRGERHSAFTALLGLIDYRRLESRKALRLLYIPWPIRWGGEGDGVAQVPRVP